MSAPSLRRLQTDYIDLAPPDPPPELLDGSSAPPYQELERLKAPGELPVYGVSLDGCWVLETVRRSPGSGALESYCSAFRQEPLPVSRLA